MKQANDRAIRAVVITVSDRASAGAYADESGPAAEAALRDAPAFADRPLEVGRRLVPDERERIAAALRDALDEGADLVVTTGGTGLALRDVTPEATLDVVDREIPGLMEMVRRESARLVPTAPLSRAVAGQRGRSLVVNLPGSPRAVRECLGLILPLLPHALAMARGGGHTDS